MMVGNCSHLPQILESNFYFTECLFLEKNVKIGETKELANTKILTNSYTLTE